MDTNVISGLTTGIHICSSIPETFGYGAYFDYYVMSGTTMRLGTVMGVWNGIGAEYTDTSTLDLGGDTSQVDLSVNLSGGNVNLIATISSGTWTIKSGVRVI
jgi:hypothetical protein